MVTKHVKLHKTNEKRCVRVARTFACVTHKKNLCKYYTCTSVVFVATISHKIYIYRHICFYSVRFRLYIYSEKSIVVSCMLLVNNMFVRITTPKILLNHSVSCYATSYWLGNLSAGALITMLFKTTV